MTVAGVGHANAAGEVQKLASIIRIDVGTFCTFGDKVEDAAPDWSHVREVFGVEGIGVYSHGVLS
jgi:hypothetical protein